MAYYGLQEKPTDPDAFRLLAEVKYELKDYEGSILAYRSAEKVSMLWTHIIIFAAEDAFLSTMIISFGNDCVPQLKLGFYVC